MIRPAASLALLIVAGCGDAGLPDAPTGADNAAVANLVEPRPPEPLPDIVRVRLETEAGPIMIALDARSAPITATNFLRYVDEGRFNDTSFYRAAPTKRADGKAIGGRGFIQGGIRRSYRRMLGPIAHEPTSQTGLKHGEGTISMARTEFGAMGEFFITTAAMPAFDAHGDEEGYAVFGRVVEGMDAVRRILAAPTVPDAGRGAMRGQMIERPVAIVRARRVE